MEAIEVKERPILFSGAMVRAILEGRKTQTRRVIDPKRVFNSLEPYRDGIFTEAGDWECAYGESNSIHIGLSSPKIAKQWCPYSKADDSEAHPGYLWVRETFARCACNTCRSVWPAKTPHGILGYQATYGGPSMMVFKPSIHMPRWASRINLEITEVRVQRVQEISTEDIIAEGVSSTLREHDAEVDLREKFHTLWDSINSKRGFGWQSNAWVWCLSFKRAEVVPRG